jgi:peptidyl-prolyl cis-trans isomerase D
MLQTIRERLTGVVAFFIIAIIAVALVISFGNMDAGIGTGRFAARVNGEDIPLLDYRQVYQNQLIRQQELYQGELPAELEAQLQRNVLEGMVRNRLVGQYVRDHGYRVGDQQVAAYIRSLPAFQVGGEFSSQSYIATLSSQGLTPEIFERDQRVNLEISQLQNGLVESAFYTPTEYRRFIELEQERRQVAYVLFEPSDFVAEIQVTEAEIRDYYAANPQLFETEESVSLEYLEVSLGDVSGEIAVDEAALVDYYEANIERFQTAEERLASHILIATDDDTDEAAAESLALDLSRRLEAGEAFAELASEFSDDPGSAADGGNLGWAGRGVYVDAFEEALFALGEGEVSAPVKTGFGYHIIRLDGVRPGAQQSLDEVREALLEELKRRGAEDRFYALAERVDDIALENPGSLEVVAQETGLSLNTIEVFTRAGGEPFGYVPRLVDAAFSPAVLVDGENSPLIELADDRAVVIRVTQHRLPELKGLEAVRAEIDETLRLEKAVRLAAERGEALLSRALDGEGLDELAAEFGVDLSGPKLLARTSSEVPADLLGVVFRTPSPADGASRIAGLSLGTGAYAVYSLDTVRPGRPEAIPRQQRDQRKTLLAQQAGAASAAGLIAELRRGAKVIVAPDLFEQDESL